MASTVDPFQVHNGDLCVQLRRLKAGVSEQLLDRPDVSSVLEQDRRTSMSEDVATAFLGQMCIVNVPFCDLAGLIGGKTGAAVGEEQVWLRGRLNPAGSDFLQIPFDPRQGPASDGDHAVARSLAAVDAHDTSVVLDVVEHQSQQLAAPHARRVEDLEHGSIPHARQPLDVDAVEDLLHLGRGEDLAGQTVFVPQPLDVGGRIAPEHAGLGQPAKEDSDRRQAHLLPANGQRTFLLLLRLAPPVPMQV